MPQSDDAAAEVTAAQLARAGVHLDEQDEARAHLHERRRWNTRVYPRMRVAGFAVLAAVVVLHALLVRPPESWRAVALFAAGSQAYALLSWAALRRWFGREPWGWPDLGDILFAVDLVLWAAAIHVTGAERSWLFFLPLLRAADQADGGVRRTLVYGHLGVLAYLGMLAWVVAVDGRVPPPGPEALKLLLLWLGGLYMAMSAAPAEGKRRQRELAVRFSRGLARRLESRARDLAEQTRQAHALRQEAEDTARNRVRVLSGVSHELRTPLNHVLGFAQLLELEELSEEQREAVDGITAGGRRLLRLVDRILEITGGDAEHGERQPLSVRPVLDTALAQLRPWIQDRELRVETTGLGAGVEAPWIMAWPRRLEQVFWNVLSSAIHHAPRGGVLRVTAVRADGRLRIGVEDPVTVISPAEVARLFEPLERVLEPGAPERGLELSIAQTLAASLGGRVDVESAPGRGTVIWIELDATAAPTRPLDVPVLR